MAMLGGEAAAVAATPSSSEKARRKKEKRRRQQQAKRDAAAQHQRAPVATEPQQSLLAEPEPSPQLVSREPTDAEPESALPEPEPASLELESYSQPEPEPAPASLSEHEAPEAPEAPEALEAADDYAELQVFLSAYRLSKHYDSLVQHEISFDALLDFDESDLKDIGLAKGPRIKMMKCAAKYRQQQQSSEERAAEGILQVPPAAAVAAAAAPAAPAAPAASTAGGAAMSTGPPQTQARARARARAEALPDDFYCPISHECMRDPVIVMETGMTYERSAIVEWLSAHNTDPSTGVELRRKQMLAPNVVLRKLIAAWKEGTEVQC
eukprot:COSAG06_NODE_1118_length_10635_cov_5.052946_16_plen_324_part_00